MHVCLYKAARASAAWSLRAARPRLPSLNTSTSASISVNHNTRRKHAAYVAATNGTDHALPPPEPSSSTNPPLSFPCLDNLDTRSASLQQRSSTTGPEPSYTTGVHQIYTSHNPLFLDWGGILREHTIAYETWGTLTHTKSNAILLHTGLSASSHARSTTENLKPGWWEKFIGPGAPLDTNKFFIICTNVLGGCYGSTGPSTKDPANGQRYATRFPILTMEDMVRAQFGLLDHLGIHRLHASVGSSMGGMQSLAAGCLFPERTGRIASISGCARSHPYSIALRHVQRQALLTDPHWARGHYYGLIPPHSGMKIARQIATVTYRSGPEWEKRFGRRRADPNKPPALCPDFLIETYLDHAGEKWCLEYDANSFLYISKAMDLFDLGATHRSMLIDRRRQTQSEMKGATTPQQAESAFCTLTLPSKPYEEQPSLQTPSTPPYVSSSDPSRDLIQGMAPLRDIPSLVMGVASDILFPSWQQYEVAQTIRKTGNRQVTHVELGEDKSLFGHDTFLLDLENIGGELQKFLG